jgi:hypothetical protein
MVARPLTPCLAASAKAALACGDDGYGAVIAAHGEGLPVVLGSPARRIDDRGRRLRVEMADGAVTADAASCAAPVRALKGIVQRLPLLSLSSALATFGSRALVAT